MDPRQEPQAVLPTQDHNIMFEFPHDVATAVIDSSAVVDGGSPHEESAAPTTAGTNGPRLDLKLEELRAKIEHLLSTDSSFGRSSATAAAAHMGMESDRIKADVQSRPPSMEGSPRKATGQS